MKALVLGASGMLGNAMLRALADDAVVIDRSLNADRFRAATGYVAPPWPELVKRMFMFK